MPLFESEKIEAIEWSFDTLFKVKDIPEWFTALLQTFSDAGRLTGHGVYFSLFSGKWQKAQEDWLHQLHLLSSRFRFDHITEHFGFMTGENFHTGAPLSIPFTKETLAIGQDRLKRIYNACHCPIGLENLAFAYSLEDVKQHGNFLSELLQPVNGFIILDLHNVYCQAKNFDLNPMDLINLYPLQLVREMHISGGSWESSQSVSGRQIRRDTHDETVPDDVFDLLPYAIARCPKLKYVVLEQLGHALDTDEARNIFQSDFMRLANILEEESNCIHHVKTNDFLPAAITVSTHPLESETLYAQQSILSKILENAVSQQHALQLLQASGFANTAWNIEHWKPYMLETAISIAQKWKHGFK